jgi:hypothetical protein
MLEQLLPAFVVHRQKSRGRRGCPRAMVRRRRSRGGGFVHHRCCANGAEGGAASSKWPREEVPSVVMEEAGGVGWGTGVQVVGPKWVWRASTCGVGEKNNSFLAETLPKLRFLWLFHLFGHHDTHVFFNKLRLMVKCYNYFKNLNYSIHQHLL